MIVLFEATTTSPEQEKLPLTRTVSAPALAASVVSWPSAGHGHGAAAGRRRWCAPARCR